MPHLVLLEVFDEVIVFLNFHFDPGHVAVVLLLADKPVGFRLLEHLLQVNLHINDLLLDILFGGVEHNFSFQLSVFQAHFFLELQVLPFEVRKYLGQERVEPVRHGDKVVTEALDFLRRFAAVEVGFADQCL